jgi:hypothetical protein
LTWQKGPDVTKGDVDSYTSASDDLRKQMMEMVTPLVRQATEAERQKSLRARYPALQDAWENYHLVLRMIEREEP